MRQAFPAITLWQPWASLIAAGCKTFEFRSRAAPARLVGQRIAIHAGARPVQVIEVRALLVKMHSANWRGTGILQREPAIRLLEAWKASPRILPLSTITCLATLGQPVRNAELAAALGLDAVNDSDRDEHSNYGWPLSDIRPVPLGPPVRGERGWWTWHGDEPSG